MKNKELLVVPLFKKFIRDTKSGKRLKPNGERIKHGTINMYINVLKHIEIIDKQLNAPLRIYIFSGVNKRQTQKEAKYWKTFYNNFTSYLYKTRDCHDNYVSIVIKVIKTFFHYMQKEYHIPIAPYMLNIHIMKKEPAVNALTPKQLKFLIHDTDFEALLNENEKVIKDIFVFGCTVALRQSDIFLIKPTNIECIDSDYYLKIFSKKTSTFTRVKLPEYAYNIVLKYMQKKDRSIFPQMSLHWFNVNLKRIALKAGWTEEVYVQKTQQGLKKKTDKGTKRLCDVISSHFMRKTAITTMITLGMPEHVARQISGHATDSKEFYRYVKYAQTYLDNEINKVHQFMSS